MLDCHCRVDHHRGPDWRQDTRLLCVRIRRGSCWWPLTICAFIQAVVPLLQMGLHAKLDPIFHTSVLLLETEFCLSPNHPGS